MAQSLKNILWKRVYRSGSSVAVLRSDPAYSSKMRATPSALCLEAKLVGSYLRLPRHKKGGAGCPRSGWIVALSDALSSIDKITWAIGVPYQARTARLQRRSSEATVFNIQLLRRLEMPLECNAFDYSTVSDVLFQLRYAAKHCGDTLKGHAEAALQEVGTQLFSVSHNFSGRSASILHPAAPTRERTLTFVTKDNGPFWLQLSTMPVPPA